MSPGDLVTAWRTDADVLARHGDTRGAELLRANAATLEAALRDQGDELLDLAAGSRESGLSIDRLRHKVSAGEIPNAGKKGAPRIRRADLPIKPQKARGGFDAAATARLITQAS